MNGGKEMLLNPERVKNEIIQWIRHYFEENGASCSAVIGISGGKDSSVAAALCVQALGRDKVIGVLMPNGIQTDIECARRLVQHLNIRSMEINIAETVTALSNAVAGNPVLQDISGNCKLSEDAKTNLPARVRMTTLYAVSQMIPGGGRVVNTCNRSEDYVGYSTKYGDAAGDFSPLSNLLVREVKQLGEVLGLPLDLIEKTPSDGLSGLSDEDKLGFTYEMLDHYILYGICEDESVKKKIDTLHVRNLHKMQPMPAYILSEA